MSATVTQRLVPIRPSPAKGLTSSTKGITFITTIASPTTLTPPRTGLKRKLEDGSPDSSKSCKRKINFGVNYIVSPQPATVARRNARERNRVKQVNTGFATLRQHIPGAAKAKKISKVDTLKQAVDYIRSLQGLLDDHDSIVTHATSVSPYSMPSSVATSHSYTTMDAAPPLQGHSRIPYATYFFNENVSPATSSLYPLSVAAASPSCSDGNTSSPSPSYYSDSSCQLSSQEMKHITIVPDEGFPSGSFFPDSYGGSFDIYSDTVPTLEEEEVLDAIASWQGRP